MQAIQTQHASIRAQQRGIPPLTPVLAFGLWGRAIRWARRCCSLLFKPVHKEDGERNRKDSIEANVRVFEVLLNPEQFRWGSDNHRKTVRRRAHLVSLVWQ